MKFFIPEIDDSQDAEKLYEATRRFAERQTSFRATPRRIFSLSYHHEGKDYYSEVGKIHARIGEAVLVILETKTLADQIVYLVCSANRSVLRGEPMLVGEGEVYQVADFE